jgi:hypothetical protein
MYFSPDGTFKIDEDGLETGKELFMRKGNRIHIFRTRREPVYIPISDMAV